MNQAKGEKRILVTGAAGFIGSHVSEALLERGNLVWGLDNFNTYYNPARKRDNIATAQSKRAFTLVEGDICDENFINNLFKEIRPEIIVHLAGMAGVTPSVERPLLYEHVNVRGTLILLEGAAKEKVQNFVFASSSSVYSGNTKIPFAETDPVERPTNPYAATKRSTELIAFTYHHLYGLNCTGLRFFNVYGPRGRPDMAPYKFARALLSGHPITLRGDGTEARDWTYISDTLSGILAAVETPLGYELINLGNSIPVQNKEFIAILEKLTGRKAEIIQEPLKPGEMIINYADVTKAARLLGYAPKMTVEEGLRLFLAWLKRAEIDEIG